MIYPMIVSILFMAAKLVNNLQSKEILSGKSASECFFQMLRFAIGHRVKGSKVQELHSPVYHCLCLIWEESSLEQRIGRKMK